MMQPASAACSGILPHTADAKESAVVSAKADLAQVPSRRNSTKHRLSESSGSFSPATMSAEEVVNHLMKNNRSWAADTWRDDETFFPRLLAQHAPDYFWIGCADARVPANTILQLDPGEVFTQRNIGNQAMHNDMNCMSCLEYGVKHLKVKVIIVCGHYQCGAVKAALQMPSGAPGLVNMWISDIRDCRNHHAAELKALPDFEAQCDRLCELNVLRQTFNVATSPAVQEAWANSQPLSIIGVVYSVGDGLLRKLVGPLTKDTDFTIAGEQEFEDQSDSDLEYSAPNSHRESLEGDRPSDAYARSTMHERNSNLHDRTSNTAKVQSLAALQAALKEAQVNTGVVAAKIGQHNSWSDSGAPTPPSRPGSSSQHVMLGAGNVLQKPGSMKVLPHSEAEKLATQLAGTLQVSESGAVEHA